MPNCYFPSLFRCVNWVALVIWCSCSTAKTQKYGATPLVPHATSSTRTWKTSRPWSKRVASKSSSRRLMRTMMSSAKTSQVLQRMHQRSTYNIILELSHKRKWLQIGSSHCVDLKWSDCQKEQSLKLVLFKQTRAHREDLQGMGRVWIHRELDGELLSCL